MKFPNITTKTFFISGLIFTLHISDAFSQGRSQDAPGRAVSEAAKANNNGKGASVPIDGGAALLLAAGAAYGMKKIREKKAKETI